MGYMCEFYTSVTAITTVDRNMNVRAAASSDGTTHIMDCKMTEASTPTTALQLPIDSSQMKTGNVLSQTAVHANLVNHLMSQNSMSSFPIMIGGQTLLASTARALEGNIVVPSVRMSSTQPSANLPGHIVKLTAGGLLPCILPSIDSNQNANPTSLMCVLTPQPAGLQLTARGTMQQRLPVASTLDRSSMAGSQPMMPYQKPVIERPKLSAVSTMTAVTLTRPAVVVQGVAGSTSVITGLAPNTVRTLLPAALRVSSAAAIPLVRAPMGTMQNRPSLSVAGVTTASTIQIAIRGALDAPSSLIPTTAVRLVTSIGPALQPKSALVMDNSSRSDFTVHPVYRQRTPMAISAPTVGSMARVTSNSIGNVAQNQAVNLTAKPKVLVSSVPQKPVSITNTPVHAVGQPVALNLSQSARPRLASVVPVMSAGSPIITGPHPATTKTVTTTTMMSSSVVPLPCGIVTIARPQRPSVAVTSQPRQKVATVMASQQSFQLQPPPQSSGNLFAASGMCSLVNRSGTAVTLTMDQFNGRLNQPIDRLDGSLQPVAVDYTSHLIPVPSRSMPEQPVASMAMLSNQTSVRPSLVLSQPMSIVLSGSGHVSSAASAGGTKLSQVVVTMDANRRTTLSLHQPNVSQQHQSLQSVMADSSATVGQSVMSPPRPTILRKRPHDANTPKKTSMANNSSAGDSTAGFLPKAEPVVVNIPVSPSKTMLPTVADTVRDTSTDTASSSGSTPRSLEKIKPELLEAVENGIIANGHAEIPRKKPRKQSLHCNEEMPAAGSSSDEDNDKRVDSEQLFARVKPRKHFDKSKDNSSQEDVSEYCDEEGVRFTIDGSRRRFPGGLVGSQRCAWKSRNNHFVSHNDIVVKEERRHTVNELSNSWRINQKCTGWSMYHAADQMSQLRELERELLDSVKVLSTRRSSRQTKSSELSEEGRVQELVLGNIQRCELYMDRLNEAQNGLISLVTSHQSRILDIIGRHQSKRSVKKKERS